MRGIGFDCIPTGGTGRGLFLSTGVCALSSSCGKEGRGFEGRFEDTAGGMLGRGFCAGVEFFSNDDEEESRSFESAKVLRTADVYFWPR